MSRRKQKFPVHLKNEQTEADEGAAEGLDEELVEEMEEPAHTPTPTPAILDAGLPQILEVVVGGVGGESRPPTPPPQPPTCAKGRATPQSAIVNQSANVIQEEEEEEEEERSAIMKRKKEEEEEEEEECVAKRRREVGASSSSSSSYVCPVCRESFRSKRSFNAHILVHCQLVNGALVGGKRAPPTPLHHAHAPTSPTRRGKEEVMGKITREEEEEEEEEEEVKKEEEEEEEEEEGAVPLDLSWSGGRGQRSGGESGIFEAECRKPLGDYPVQASGHSWNPLLPNGVSQPPHSTLYPPRHPHTPFYALSMDRGPLEDENDNLVNEAREREKAFLDLTQNEQYLTEDSTGLDPPPPLPLYGTGGAVRRVRVGGEEGAPPMVYSVRLHAEQVLVTRILGINDETGDKMELYKCFICRVAFPSVTRLQAHLSQHKQRFICSKCNFSCDSRVKFSSHVQHEHLSESVEGVGCVGGVPYVSEGAVLTTGAAVPAAVTAVRDSMEGQTRVGGQCQDDPSSAENTVTVAALLSALREKQRGGGAGTQGRGGRGRASPTSPEVEIEEENMSSDDSYPRSPGCDVGVSAAGGGVGRDEVFKVYRCRFCGKKFERAFSCNRHERVHTGYKPCFCRVCGRGFSEPRNLRHHVIRFHSDGSLRHLIKRDRRRKADEDAVSAPCNPPSSVITPPNVTIKNVFGKAAATHTPPVQPPQSPPSPAAPPPPPPETRFKDVLKETANKLISSSNIDIATLSGKNSGLEITLTGKTAPTTPSPGPQSPSPPPTTAAAATTATMTTYTTSLTKIIAASLDNARTTPTPTSAPNTPSSTPTPKRVTISLGVDAGQDSGFRGQDLEPGEIRLDGRTRIVDDDGGGRRLIVADDDEADHSPHFSNYAPRLHIIQEPLERDKAVVPITDDIGRTFFQCPYCHKLFGSTSDMNRHLDFHEDLRPYNCEYCDYSARTNSQLKVHKMRHEGIKLYSCDVCNYNGVTQSDLNRHKKTQSHIARSHNICAICGLGFYTASQKQVHIVQCHPEVEGASSLIQMSLGPPVAPLLAPPPPLPPPPPVTEDISEEASTTGVVTDVHTDTHTNAHTHIPSSPPVSPPPPPPPLNPIHTQTAAV